MKIFKYIILALLIFIGYILSPIARSLFVEAFLNKSLEIDSLADNIFSQTEFEITAKGESFKVYDKFNLVRKIYDYNQDTFNVVYTDDVRLIKVDAGENFEISTSEDYGRVYKNIFILKSGLHKPYSTRFSLSVNQKGEFGQFLGADPTQHSKRSD